MMTKLIEEVKELVERERGRAGAQFGLTNNSDHESYAVLLEEFQEAQTEVDTVDDKLSVFWGLVKANGSPETKFNVLKSMEDTAILAACELIQVAAMAKKAEITVCDRISVKEMKEGGRSE